MKKITQLNQIVYDLIMMDYICVLNPGDLELEKNLDEESKFLKDRIIMFTLINPKQEQEYPDFGLFFTPEGPQFVMEHEDGLSLYHSGKQFREDLSEFVTDLKD